jgi:hypothetical protein
MTCGGADVSKLNSTELSRYERAQRDYWDLINVLNSAEKNGIEKGKAEGEAKGISQAMHKVARSLKKGGISNRNDFQSDRPLHRRD